MIFRAMRKGRNTQTNRLEKKKKASIEKRDCAADNERRRNGGISRTRGRINKWDPAKMADAVKEYNDNKGKLNQEILLVVLE